MPIKQINLKEIFRSLEHKYYTIIKLPDEFPSYKTGSDLDIFCYDMQDVVKMVLSGLKEQIGENFTIKIHERDYQIYIDVMEKDAIHFRFDLYGCIPQYNNVDIKKSFFSSVIENSEILTVDDFKIKVPAAMDEVILRYIEYHEWFVQRPDKIKHIDYIEHLLNKKEVDLDKFLDKLHFYITVPKVFEDRHVSRFQSVRSLQHVMSSAKKVIVMVKEKGVKSTTKAIAEKINK